jgi:hypothetical protein
MAYMIRVYVDFAWVGDGTASSMLGQNQSNEPGYAAALGPGPVPGSQVVSLQVSEFVPGGDTPTLANFKTALDAASADLAGTPAAGGSPIMSQAGAYSGGTPTPLALIQGFATGNP